VAAACTWPSAAATGRRRLPSGPRRGFALTGTAAAAVLTLLVAAALLPAAATAQGAPNPDEILDSVVRGYADASAGWLEYWVQHAADREVSRQGKKRTIAGNGLAAAIVRKGRLIFIDEDLFLVWLYQTTR
jgi:hypothetical protein